MAQHSPRDYSRAFHARGILCDSVRSRVLGTVSGRRDMLDAPWRRIARVCHRQDVFLEPLLRTWIVLLMLAVSLSGCIPSARYLLQLASEHWVRITLGGGGGQTGIAIDPTDTDTVYVSTDNGGIVKSIDRGDTWFSINNNLGNGLIADIELDPLNSLVLYAAAEVYRSSPSWSEDLPNGELYRTEDGGQSWNIVYAEGMGPAGRTFSISQWPSTRNILIPYDPADPVRYDADRDHLTDVIYVGGWDEDQDATDKRGGIWKSTDEGATFDQIALNDRNIWVLRQDPQDPATLFAGTYGDGLFVSYDEGATWQDWRPRIPLPMISDVTVSQDALYVATNAFFSEYSSDEYADKRGLYKSVDGGASFFPINSGLERTSLDFEALVLDVTDASGQTLYTGPWGGSQQGIYRTTDGGDHWTRMKHETSSQPDWLDGFDNLWSLEQARDGTMFATSWRAIYGYSPSTHRWDLKVSGLGNVAVESVAFEPGSDRVIYLGLLDSAPWKSVDGGATWARIGEGFVTADGSRWAGALDFAISEANPQVVYAIGIGPSGRHLSAVNRSVDGGAHWDRVTNGLPPTSTEDPRWQATAIEVSAADASIAYVALDLEEAGGSIYRTTDGGESWSRVHELAQTPTDMAISSTSPETVACATRQGVLYVSRDGGALWQSFDLGTGLIYAVDVFPTDPDRILVGANVSGAYLTTDGGQTWRRIFGQDALWPFVGDLALSDYAKGRYWPTIRDVKFDPTDPEILYIGHNPDPWLGVGILKSMDQGQTWTTVADKGFQMRSVRAFDVDSSGSNLVVGSWELYYYRGDLPGSAGLTGQPTPGQR